MPGKPGGSVASRPPSGLSRRAQARWAKLHELNDFLPHEDFQLEYALTWFDQADVLRREARKLRGRERAARLKSAAEASTVGLRHWRTLKFSDPAKPARRPGRPPGKPWMLAHAHE
jgi:hypothetical protein